MTEGGALARLRERAVRAWYGRAGIPRTVNGLRLRVDPAARHTFTPVYDAGAAAFLQHALQPGMEAWNVGANVGIYTLQLAHWVAPGGRVLAFEPNPAARAVLRRNLELNGVTRRVEVVASAAGAAAGSVDFYAAGSDGMSRAGRANPRLSSTSRIEVPVTTLDAAAAGRGRRPDVVVMDVEGWEIAALQGAATLLGSSRFVVELHPDAWEWSGHCRADLERLLDAAGLVARPVSGQRDPLGELGQVVLEPGRQRVS